MQDAVNAQSLSALLKGLTRTDRVYVKIHGEELPVTPSTIRHAIADRKLVIDLDVLPREPEPPTIPLFKENPDA